MIAARVVGEDVKNWFKCIIIDKGRESGHQGEDACRDAQGLVGQAVEVDSGIQRSWSSTIRIPPLTYMWRESRHRGLLEGTGQNTLKLKYVVKNDEIEIGDKLVTSGKDGIFPKGMPVGIVITVNRNKSGIFTDIDVMPLQQF